MLTLVITQLLTWQGDGKLQGSPFGGDDGAAWAAWPSNVCGVRLGGLHTSLQGVNAQGWAGYRSLLDMYRLSKNKVTDQGGHEAHPGCDAMLHI